MLYTTKRQNHLHKLELLQNGKFPIILFTQPSQTIDTNLRLTKES